jgi:hypothetical protein
MTDINEATELHINSTKKAEMEFDVHIQGISSDEPMEVRFLIKDADCGGTLQFDCEHVEEDKWCVKFPVMKSVLKKASYKFVLEVIVDGYYFAPADGSISFIADPTVNMTKKKSKPTVKASFTVKQDVDEAVAEEVVEERVAQAAGNSGGLGDPSNQLLTPEFPAEEVPEAKDDEDEEDTKEVTADKFDPASVAEGILKGTFGNVKAPVNKGFLFNRTGDGRVAVKGLEDKVTKQQQAEKAAKVKQILADQ